MNLPISLHNFGHSALYVMSMLQVMNIHKYCIWPSYSIRLEAIIFQQ